MDGSPILFRCKYCQGEFENVSDHFHECKVLERLIKEPPPEPPPKLVVLETSHERKPLKEDGQKPWEAEGISRRTWYRRRAGNNS